MPKEFLFQIFENSNVEVHCLKQIICLGLWSRGILTKFSYKSKYAGDKNITSLVIVIISRHLLSKHVFTISALFSKIMIRVDGSLPAVRALLLVYPHHGPVWRPDWHSVLHISSLQYTASVSHTLFYFLWKILIANSAARSSIDRYPPSYALLCSVMLSTETVLAAGCQSLVHT